MVYHKVLSWDLFCLVSLSVTYHYTWKYKSVDCDMLADDTTLHTSEKYVQQIRSNMQDSLDQVSKWCDNNHNYGQQSDQVQVYGNRCHTETPVVTLTARSRSKRGKN